MNVLMYTACTFRDLTYIEELKDWREKDKGFVNWKKMEMLFEVLRIGGVLIDLFMNLLLFKYLFLVDFFQILL